MLLLVGVFAGCKNIITRLAIRGNKSVLETQIGKQFVGVALLRGENIRRASGDEKKCWLGDKSYATPAT